MDGLKYLLKIAIPVLLLVTVVVFAVRGCSLTQRYSAHQHTIYSLAKPWIFIEPGPEGPPNISPSAVALWTLLPQSFDPPSQDIEKIEQYLAENNGPLALFLPENRPGFSDQLIAHVNERGLEERTLFLSPHDGLLRDLRSELPGALFSMGRGDTTQLFMLHAFYLEPAAKFSADFLILEPQFLADGGGLPRRLYGEIQRRKKSVLLDLREQEELPEELPAADGYLLKAHSRTFEILRGLRSKEGGQDAP